MSYLGRRGASAALTSADIPDNSITAAKIVEGTITVGDIGTDAVGTDELANDVVISTSGAITTTGAFRSIGIDDNADALAITIDPSENVGIGVVPDMLRTTDTALALGATARQFVTSSNHYVDMNNIKLDASGNPLHITTAPATRHQQLNTGVHTFDVAPSASSGAAVSFSNAITIDNSGRVTTPNQPAFRCYAVPTPAEGAVGNHATWIEVFDVGNNFTPGDGGYFTAPIAGVYAFSVHANFSTALPSGITSSFWAIMVDDVTKDVFYTSYNTANYMLLSGSAIHSLTANQIIKFNYKGDPDSGLGWCHCSGYLIG